MLYPAVKWQFGEETIGDVDQCVVKRVLVPQFALLGRLNARLVQFTDELLLVIAVCVLEILYIGALPDLEFKYKQVLIEGFEY